MLKTEVISVGIPATFPDVDWFVRDWDRFWGWFWGRFPGWFWGRCWPLRTAFPRIPVLRVPRWEEEKSRSTCSNRDGSLRVDRSKWSSFWLRFLFNDPEGRPRGVITRGFSISWRRGSSGSQRLTGGGRCAKQEFPSKIAFLVEEEFSVEVAHVGERKTSDEEKVVEKRFSGEGRFSGEAKFCYRGVLGKEDFWDRESAFNSTPLFFQES